MYANPTEETWEAIFLFPIDSEDTALSKIKVEFTLSDGTVKNFETLIDERVKLEAKYEDAVS